MGKACKRFHLLNVKCQMSFNEMRILSENDVPRGFVTAIESVALRVRLGAA